MKQRDLYLIPETASQDVKARKSTVFSGPFGPVRGRDLCLTKIVKGKKKKKRTTKPYLFVLIPEESNSGFFFFNLLKLGV